MLPHRPSQQHSDAGHTQPVECQGINPRPFYHRNQGCRDAEDADDDENTARPHHAYISSLHTAEQRKVPRRIALWIGSAEAPRPEHPRTALPDANAPTSAASPSQAPQAAASGVHVHPRGRWRCVSATQGARAEPSPRSSSQPFRAQTSRGPPQSWPSLRRQQTATAWLIRHPPIRDADPGSLHLPAIRMQ